MKKVYKNSIKRVDEEVEKDIEDVQVEEVQEEVTDEQTDEVPEDGEEVEQEEELEQEEEERATDEVPAEPAEVEEEVNEQTDENIVEGIGIVFNSLSEDLGGFREIIRPEAVTQELINNSDIYYLYNHNDNMLVLARSNNGEGSLKLEIKEDGLHYSFNCLDNIIYQTIKRGDLNKSSFAFELPNDGTGEEWIKSAEHNYIRYINKIEKLHDISCVLNPAYSETTVYARSNNNNKQVEESYYNQYENIIDSLLN